MKYNAGIFPETHGYAGMMGFSLRYHVALRREVSRGMLEADSKQLAGVDDAILGALNSQTKVVEHASHDRTVGSYAGMWRE